MNMRSMIAILLSQAEINNIHLIRSSAKAHKEIVRLDITMQETLWVYILDATYQLVRKHQNCFEWEFGMRIWKVIRKFLNRCYSLPRLLFAFSLIYRLLIHFKPVQSWISINNLCVFEWSILYSVYISVRYLRSDIHHYLS